MFTSDNEHQEAWPVMNDAMNANISLILQPRKLNKYNQIAMYEFVSAICGQYGMDTGYITFLT